MKEEKWERVRKEVKTEINKIHKRTHTFKGAMQTKAEPII